MCLERPLEDPNPLNRKEKVLIWGISSSFGSIAAQYAEQAGYTVVGTASERHREIASSHGVSHFVDRTSPTVIQELIALGPFKAVLLASDSAEDQVKIGQVLAAHGGGHFLTTMGVRPGVQLPKGVTGAFYQYLDDYLDPKNEQFKQWFWWDYLEDTFAKNGVKALPVEVFGGLSKVKEAWDLLRAERVSGKRLIIKPELD